MAESKKIENIENKKNSFVSKRNVILFTCFLILTIVLVCVAIFSFLKIDIVSFFKIIGESFVQNKFVGWWISCSLIISLFTIFFKIFPIIIRLKEMNIKVGFFQYFCLSGVMCFLSFISPLPILVDSYVAFWFRQQNISTYKATALSLSNSFLVYIGQILITIPSFIFLCFNYSIQSLNTDWFISFWCVIAGLIVDVIIFIFFVVVLFSKNIHLWMSLLWNYIKKILKIKYHTKAETIQKYKENESFKRYTINQLKKWIGSFSIVLFSIANEFLIYVIMYFSVVQFTYSPIDFWPIFNTINVSVTASKFIPTPSGALTIEFFLSAFLNTNASIKESIANNTWIINENNEADITSIINDSIFTWRIYYSYFPTFIGFFPFMYVVIDSIKRFKSNKLLVNKK